MNPVWTSSSQARNRPSAVERGEGVGPGVVEIVVVLRRGLVEPGQGQERRRRREVAQRVSEPGADPARLPDRDQQRQPDPADHEDRRQRQGHRHRRRDRQGPEPADPPGARRHSRASASRPSDTNRSEAYGLTSAAYRKGQPATAKIATASKQRHPLDHPPRRVPEQRHARHPAERREQPQAHFREPEQLHRRQLDRPGTGPGSPAGSRAAGRGRRNPRSRKFAAIIVSSHQSGKFSRYRATLSNTPSATNPAVARADPRGRPEIGRRPPARRPSAASAPRPPPRNPFPCPTPKRGRPS